jgi:hypothetical protein
VSAADVSARPAAWPEPTLVGAYVIERTCAAGALKRLDAVTGKQVNVNNGSLGVRRI